MTLRIPDRIPPHWRSPKRVALAALVVAAFASAVKWISALPLASAHAAGGIAAAIAAPSAFRLADDVIPPPAENQRRAANGSAEARLIGIYRSIADRRFGDALADADALVEDHPNFRLAQLVRADLLAARVSPLKEFGGGLARTEVAPLRQEAMLRLRALQERPPAGAVPGEFVRLPPSVPYAIAVDTSRARLYFFENGPAGVRLLGDYYVSIGKQGVDKSIEGDQRTPLGVYFVTDRLDASVLEDRFGSRALPLNYPNAFDKAQGRTGSGILLHGVPTSTYSRPPLDSDGCVVLANDDLTKLAALLPQRDTPVIITRAIRWVTPQAGAHERDDFLARLAAWREARDRGDESALLPFYADPASVPAAAAPIAPLDDWSVLTWSESPGTMVVTYREPGVRKKARARVMRQYWTLASGHWTILNESPVR